MDFWTMMIRFALTFLFSLVFGLERQRSHKPIGFGTFIFVAMGSCSLGIAAMILPFENPLPLLSAIVTGIGFLGAGALIKTTDKVFGFTTAAGIWVFAIIGLLTGTGNYILAISLYISVWMVVFVDSYLEHRGIGSYQKKITLITSENINDKELSTLLGSKFYKIVSIEVMKPENKLIISILLEGTKDYINKLPPRLNEKKWITSFKIE